MRFSSKSEVIPDTEVDASGEASKTFFRSLLKEDTASFNQGNLGDTLRKEGYEEVPLDELQDRLSKLPGPLAEIILKGRM